MIDDRDVWQAALLIVKRYGADAMFEAAARAISIRRPRLFDRVPTPSLSGEARGSYAVRGGNLDGPRSPHRLASIGTFSPTVPADPRPRPTPHIPARFSAAIL